MTTIVKEYGWENVQPGKCRKGDAHSGKFLLGKCPVGTVSVKELSFKEVSVWDLSTGKSQSRYQSITLS